MRRFLLFAAFSVFLIIPTISNAQSTAISVDVQNLTRQEITASPLAGVFVGRNFKDSQYGGWTYTAITPTWGEFLAGPSTHSMWKGGHYVEAGIGIGVEQPGFAVRGGAYGLIEGEKLSALLFLEHGAGTGFWYFFRAIHTITGSFSAGIHAQRYFGVGPRFQLDFGPTKLWTAPVYDHEAADQQWGVAVGVGVSF